MDQFDDIYREYHPRIYRYLSGMCGETDARDLAQTVFFKISRSLDSFRGESSLATWIFRIAANTARDHAHSLQARQQGKEDLVGEAGSLDDYPATDSPGTDREYIRREMGACIRSVTEQLPESYRDVLLLSEFEELSNREVADILGISVETVKIRLHRARTGLRKAMMCQCSLYHDERNELMCDRKA